jgi:TonB family protein
MVLPLANGRRLGAIYFVLAASLLLATPTARGQSASEYQVKAAYLYNFAKLAEWPDNGFSTPTSPIVFCVLGGDDDFVAMLRNTLRNKSINAHSLVAKALSSPSETDSCTLLFLRGSEKSRVPGVISGVKKSSTLLVGEDSSFLKNGGMINLVLKEGKVRFEVNSLALDRADIRFDTSFLNMAQSDAGSTRVQNSGSRAVRSNIPPKYPDLARQMNITGAVQLQVTVDAGGSVKDVRVLGGHPVLVQAAVQAVRSWKYRSGPAESVELVHLIFGQ